MILSQLHSMTLTVMPPLDQGPHLPGETAEKEDEDEGRRREGMRDEWMGNRKGYEGDAFGLLKWDCLCKQTYFYMPLPKLSFTQPASFPLCVSCLTSMFRFNFCFMQCHNPNLYWRRLTHASWFNFHITPSHFVRHHHVLTVIIVQLLQISTPPRFPSHLFVCIGARLASLTCSLLPSLQTPTLPCLFSFG